MKNQKNIDLKSCVWEDLTNQYSLSKTLRFELIPQGKTLKYIIKKRESGLNLIEEDEKRDKDFLEVKNIIDNYLSYFIERNLSPKENIFSNEDLKEFHKVYEKLKKDQKNKELKKRYISLQSKLRKKIYDHFKNKQELKLLLKNTKKFINDILLNFYLKNTSETEKYKKVESFKGWVTYFSSYKKNRENIFTDKEIPTSLTYRIVNDNLPRFLDNIRKFNEIKDKLPVLEIEEKFKDYLEGMTLDVFFNLYNFNNFLNQEGIDKFNLLIGGRSPDGEKKVKGLNEYINELAQIDKENGRYIKKLKLLPLYKQILSESSSSSFQFEKINSDKELFDKVKSFNDNLEKNNFYNNLRELFSELDKHDLKEIYVQSKSITEISQHLFGNWEKLKIGLSEYASQDLLLNEKSVNKWLKRKYFSIYELEEAIEKLKIRTEFDDELYNNFVNKINNNLKHPICGFLSSFKKKDNDLLKDINKRFTDFEKISKKNWNYKEKKLLEKEFEEDVKIIKFYLDSLKNLLHYIKPIYIKQDSNENEFLEIDGDFYEKFNNLYNILKELISIYNQARNYITQKPFSTKKFKLNFDSSHLLTGWSSDFNTNAGIILIKDNKYYLGIIPKKLSKEDLDELNKISVNKIKLMIYDFQKPDSKNVPRLFIRSKGDSFAPAVKKYNLPISEIIEIYDKGYFKTDFKKKDPVLFKKSLTKLIDYFKEGFLKHESYKHYNFKWKNSNEYENISDFYKDVADSCYQLNFREINLDKIDELVDEGKIYLFQIYNKDFSTNKIDKNKNSRKNLHTIYWEELFSEENLKDVVYKLNGEAEIFYRRKSLERKVTHPKNEPIKNKDPIKGKEYSTFTKYDLIKDKRYTEDKFLFHCPITINFKARGSKWDINKIVNKIIKENFDKINILSIDRGERHLAYWTLLNSKGEIIEQGSFNVIKEETIGRETNYLEKLEEKEISRDEARKNWKKIENIKELKEGYLSQIVHKIAKLVVEKNAIVVFEDLNSGFKRGRFKIERQVYQKFEKMLVNKLNYIVFKNRDKKELCGSLRALQLTPEIKIEKERGKQVGIIFYVDPSYTSKIDPKTGFVNLLYPKYESIEKSKEFFKKFKYVKFNGEYFEFNFDYRNFRNNFNIKRKNWTICSYGERINVYRNKEKNNLFDYEKIDITKKTKELFDKYNIDYINNENILEDIITQNSKEFFKDLIFLLNKILQLRNSNPNTGEDFILSPVKDKNGEFFDTRKAKDDEPQNADSNGAYNIGIKGLMIINKIKNSKKTYDKIKSDDFKITRDEFVNFLIERNA